MHIKDGILFDGDKPVRFVKAHASGGSMTPRLACIHDTAGRDTKFSSVNWFASKECGTSAHFVVERDGTVTQMVSTNRRAYHAGVSSWKGISGLNSCSVGIEIVNPGKLDASGKAWFGHAASPSEIEAKGTPAHGNGYWLPYTPEQIAAVTGICRALVEEYPDCNEIVTHWEISPGRKIDTNPLFPLRELRKAVFDPKPTEVIEPLPPPELPEAPPAPVVVQAPEKPVSHVREAAKSRSVWSLLSGLCLWIVSNIRDAVHWVTERASDLVSFVESVQTDVEGGLAPLQALAGLVKANVGRILPVLGTVLICVAVARHIQLRVEAAEMKRKLEAKL